MPSLTIKIRQHATAGRPNVLSQMSAQVQARRQATSATQDLPKPLGQQMRTRVEARLLPLLCFGPLLHCHAGSGGLDQVLQPDRDCHRDDRHSGRQPGLLLGSSGPLGQAHHQRQGHICCLRPGMTCMTQPNTLHFCVPSTSSATRPHLLPLAA